MRTIVLLGVAAATVTWANPAHAAHDSQVIEAAPGERVVIRRDMEYADGTPQDVRVYVSRDDRALTEAEYRNRWQGDWDGQWTPDGQVWSGTYRGTYSRDRDAQDHHGYGDPRADGDDRYEREIVYRDEDRGRDGGDRWDDREMERLCGRRDTATGVIVGGILGGVAGNRIAGRGNRTEGTIIGGVVGAAAGAAIGSAADRQRCERWAGSDRRYAQSRQMRGQYRQRPAYPGYAYAYPAYYYPAPTVTTVIVEGGCGCAQTTETITTTEYETVYAAPAKRVVRKYAAPTKRAPVKTKRVYRK